MQVLHRTDGTPDVAWVEQREYGLRDESDQEELLFVVTACRIHSWVVVRLGGVEIRTILALMPGVFRSPELGIPPPPIPFRDDQMEILSAPEDFGREIHVVADQENDAISDPNGKFIHQGLWHSAYVSGGTLVGHGDRLYIVPHDDLENLADHIKEIGAEALQKYDSFGDPTLNHIDSKGVIRHQGRPSVRPEPPEKGKPSEPGCSVALGLFAFIVLFALLAIVMSNWLGDESRVERLSFFAALALAGITAWRYHCIPVTIRTRIRSVVVRVFEGMCYAVIAATITFLLIPLLFSIISVNAGELLTMMALVFWGAVSLIVGTLVFLRAYRQSTGTIESGHHFPEPKRQSSIRRASIAGIAEPRDEAILSRPADSNSSSYVRNAAVLRQKEAQPKWRHSQPKERIRATGTLKDCGILRGIVRDDPDERVRQAAARRLESLKKEGKDAFEALVRLLRKGKKIGESDAFAFAAAESLQVYLPEVHKEMEKVGETATQNPWLIGALACVAADPKPYFTALLNPMRNADEGVVVAPLLRINADGSAQIARDVRDVYGGGLGAALGNIAAWGADTTAMNSQNSMRRALSMLGEKGCNHLEELRGDFPDQVSELLENNRKESQIISAVKELTAKLESTDSYPTAVATIEKIANYGHEAVGAIPAIVDKAASGGHFDLLFNSVSIVDIAKACGQEGATVAITSLASSLARVNKLMYWMTAVIYIEDLLDYGADGSASVPYLTVALEALDTHNIDADKAQFIDKLRTNINRLIAKIQSRGQSM